jgi:hypothetical protein
MQKEDIRDLFWHWYWKYIEAIGVQWTPDIMMIKH